MIAAQPPYKPPILVAISGANRDCKQVNGIVSDYHQKYYLRNDRALMAEFRAAYPDDSQFVNSTAAARVNGYLYGAAGCARLEKELPDLGLSEEGASRLRAGCARR